MSDPLEQINELNEKENSNKKLNFVGFREITENENNEIAENDKFNTPEGKALTSILGNSNSNVQQRSNTRRKTIVDNLKKFVFPIEFTLEVKNNKKINP